MKKSMALQVTVLTMVAFVASCSQEEKEQKNTPPTWVNAIDNLTIGQGQSETIPFTASDVDGDTFEVSISAPNGIESRLGPAEDEIEIWADYSVAGEVELHVELTDAAGEMSTHAIVLDVRELAWTKKQNWGIADGPEAREHGSFIVDVENHRVLLFGGSGYSPYMDPLNDLWEYDLSSGEWSELTPSGDLPFAGGSHRVAQVPESSTAYLHGGYSASGEYHDKLYKVDYSDDDVVFTEMNQINSPTERSLHAFAYDPVGQQFVLFGGIKSNPWTVLADTWIMTVDGDTATWEQLELESAPSPRYGFFYGFDKKNQRLLLFSGAQALSSVDPAHDTWTLELATDPPAWNLLLEGENDGVPPGRRNGCMVFDESGPRMFVFGGTPDAQTAEPGLFVLDARPGHESWHRIETDDEPPPRSSGFGFFDPTGDQRFFGFGNSSIGIYSDLASLGYEAPH